MMKSNTKRNHVSRKLFCTMTAGALVLGLMPVALTGCNSANSSTGNTTGAQTSQTSAATTDVSSLTDLAAYDLSYTDRDSNASYDENTAVKVALNGTSASVSGVVGVDTSGVTVDGSTVTITKEGVYIFSGTLTDGQIQVKCNEADKAKVQIVLNGVNITNSKGSALYVEEAKKVFVTLASGTTNTLTDSATYSLNQDDGNADACIYSKDNLTFQGSGTLTVTGKYQDAIASKDELIFTGGTYNLTAADDGVRGKDDVKIKDGTFTITAQTDAIKSTNSDTDGKGFVAVDGGTINIAAGDDAFHAESLLLINGGTVDISKSYEGLEGRVIIMNDGNVHLVSSDDGVNASAGSTSDSQALDAGAAGFNHKQDMQGMGDMNNDGTNPRDASNTGGQVPDGQTPSGQAPDGQAQNRQTPSGQAPDGQTQNMQGSNGQMPNGQMPSGQAPDGQPQNTQAPSGQMPNTNSSTGNTTGNTAQTDPGTQDANGMQGMRGGMGGGMMDGDTNCVFQMNGGYLVVDAGGDGLDSNGAFEMNGGTVLVSGPTTSADAAMDYGTTATVNGGTLIALGAQGMAENFTSGSQAFALINVSGSAGDTVAVTDNSGNVLASFKTNKAYQCAVVSTNGMKDGTTYNFVSGCTVSGANSDGYTTSGKATGGTTTNFTASTTDTSNTAGAGMPQGMGQQNADGTQGRQGGKMWSQGTQQGNAV